MWVKQTCDTAVYLSSRSLQSAARVMIIKLGEQAPAFHRPAGFGTSSVICMSSLHYRSSRIYIVFVRMESKYNWIIALLDNNIHTCELNKHVILLCIWAQDHFSQLQWSWSSRRENKLQHFIDLQVLEHHQWSILSFMLCDLVIT